MPGRWASSSSLTRISSSTARRARRNRASASSARWRSRRYAASAFRCSASVFACSRRTSAVLTSDAAESRMSATTPAPTIDGCRRDQARSRSAGVGRRARIGRPSRNRCRSSASSCAVA